MTEDRRPASSAWLADDDSYQDVGDRLGITVNTVGNARQARGGLVLAPDEPARHPRYLTVTVARIQG